MDISQRGSHRLGHGNIHAWQRQQQFDVRLPVGLLGELLIEFRNLFFDQGKHLQQAAERTGALRIEFQALQPGESPFAE